MRPPALPRRLSAVLSWIAAVGFIAGTVIIYRWAEPSRHEEAHIQQASTGSNVTMRLENAPFVGHSNGFKTWSLKARLIELERMPGSSLASIESVTLTDIQNGLLFPAPPTPASGVAPPAPSGLPAGGQTAIGQIPPEAEKPYGPWTAQFRAGRGHYNSGMLAQLPPDLAEFYRLQAEFALTQGAVLRTREGDRFEADTVHVLDMQNKRTGRSERRILCENGMKLTRKDAQAAANQARYDTVTRTVECLGGAHITFPDGVIQTERMYWSLDEGVLRSPESTSGTIQGMPFTARSMTFDLKKHTMHANGIHFDLRSDSQGVRTH